MLFRILSTKYTVSFLTLMAFFLNGVFTKQKVVFLKENPYI